MFLLNGPFPAQLTVNMFNKSCRWQDSSPGRLVSEATVLLTVPLLHSHALWLVKFEPRFLCTLMFSRPNPIGCHACASLLCCAFFFFYFEDKLNWHLTSTGTTSETIFLEAKIQNLKKWFFRFSFAAKHLPLRQTQNVGKRQNRKKCSSLKSIA